MLRCCGNRAGRESRGLDADQCCWTGKTGTHGAKAHYPDADYEEVGVELVADHAAALGAADLVLRVRKPSPDDIVGMKRGSWHVSFLDPFNEKDLIGSFSSAGVNAVSLEMIPRTTLAQKMDALSSQASLAGYAAVVEGAQRLQMALPMMMTPAGTIMPARVFVIGAGVAGLQAIATAKRLGARVDAFDTRPVVEEQVRSLGAKFVKIDLGETGQTAGGYAKALTPEQVEKQQAGMAKIIAQSDIVITTAKLFGRPAPKLHARRNEIRERGRRSCGRRRRQCRRLEIGRRCRDRQWRDDHRPSLFGRHGGDSLDPGARGELRGVDHPFLG